MELSVHCSVFAMDNGVNNRSTYALRVEHRNSSDTLLDTYYLDSMYIRDDANTYDSGGMGAATIRLFVAASDYIQVETEVLDVQTTTGTVNADTTRSLIKIDRITYS